jgi:hypothetical protein
MIETKDLWQSAYLLSEGVRLAGVEVRKKSDGRNEFVFRLVGEDADDLAQRFRDGLAGCNVRKLKTHVSHLKQVIFGGACAARE